MSEPLQEELRGSPNPRTQIKPGPGANTPRIIDEESNALQTRDSGEKQPEFEGRLEKVEMDGSSISSSRTVGGPFDYEKILRDGIKRRTEAGIMPRELGVYFKDLRVVGLGAKVSYQPTLGSFLSPRDIARRIMAGRHPPVRDLLSGFEGVVRPGEMLLVLGQPGSGCSTLLKTLANHRGEYHAIDGEVHYDSLSPKELSERFRGDVQYCPEDDVHFASLTVDQTLNFAVTTRTPQTRVGQTRDEYIRNETDLLTTLFGLNHAKNTQIGDAMIRGISGGEKKRVSIAESLASRSCVGAWDNSTRGLDSSTALEFVQALRIATNVSKLTTIVSLYQAGEPLYELFDKVCVVYEGEMAYFGPAKQARKYFIDMGYEPANRQTTSDFLVAVTDPNSRISRGDASSLPKTATEFADHFKKSASGGINRQDMELYQTHFIGVPNRAVEFRKSAAAEHADHARKDSPYIISIPMQARAVMRRRIQILRGSYLALGLTVISFMLQSIIMGTVFLQVSETTSDYYSRGGLMFFALLFTAVSSMAEIPVLFHQRPIVFRHQKAAMYHPFIEAAAHTIVDIPIAITTTISSSVILYFLVGLQKSASQFFIYILFVFAVSMCMKGWFRGIASAFGSDAVAQSFAGVSVLALVIYTGYTIPKPTMIGALRWITYINPLRYGFEAVLSNEFHTLNGKCSNLIPRGDGYENVSVLNQVCTVVGAESGNPNVDGNQFIKLSYGFSYNNLWMNFGIVLAFTVAFFAAVLTFTEYNTTSMRETSIILFKRGSKIAGEKEGKQNGSDEEKAGFSEDIVDYTPSPSKRDSFKELQTNNIFSWQHVSYTVPLDNGDSRQLLEDISGYVAPGRLTALMGESGAGKTTLLNVLAQRITAGVVIGDKFVNGQALPRDFQAQTGYCQQMDTHLDTATVREALLFSAKLRQPSSVPLAEKVAYVEECLKMVGMEAFADAIIGTLGIEHRKRTTIGVELAAKPKLLLFLDEPTSGLDSQSSWGILKMLRSLANNGQAILCTIHQPSAELFQAFDRLLLLRKGGQTVYVGDIGVNCGTLIEYFQRNGSRHCTSEENPAEFMLDVVGAGATATSDRDWYEIWKRSPEAGRLQTEIAHIHDEGRSRPAVEAKLDSEFATSWGYQTTEVLKRNLQHHWRSPTYLVAKLVLNAFGGLFIGFTFFHSKDTQQGTQNRLFALFMGTVLAVPLSNQLIIPFIKIRSVYEIRERPSRTYSWSAWVTAQILVEIPWNILGSIVFFFCWYWTVGFPSSRAGYTFLVLCFLFPVYFTTIASAFSAMSPSPEIATLLFGFFFQFVITFNGVLQPFARLGWWRWMYRLSPYTYLIEGLLGYTMGKQLISCASVEVVKLNPPSGFSCGSYLQKYISANGGYLLNPDATNACEFCSTRTTDEFLGRNFNIFYHHHWRNVAIICAYIVFNTACVYAATYVFRIHTGSFLPSFRRRKSKSAAKV